MREIGYRPQFSLQHDHSTPTEARETNPAAEVHDVLMRAEEVNTWLPTLQAAIFETDITDEERTAREQTIEKIRADIEDLATLAASVSNALDPEQQHTQQTFSFADITQSPGWKQLVDRLAQVEKARSVTEIKTLLSSYESELNNESRAPLPPREFDPAWYDTADIEIANALLIYEFDRMHQLADETLQHDLDTVMGFLADQRILQIVAERKNDYDATIDPPPSLAWIQEKTPDVFAALQRLTQSKAGKDTLAHIAGEATGADDIFDPLSAPHQQEEIEDKLPNALAIAVSLSRDRLSHQNSAVREAERQAIESLYGQLDTETDTSAEDMLFDLMREQVVEKINGKETKQLISDMWEHLSHPLKKETLLWNKWEHALAVFSEQADLLTIKELNDFFVRFNQMLSELQTQWATKQTQFQEATAEALTIKKNIEQHESEDTDASIFQKVLGIPLKKYARGRKAKKRAKRKEDAQQFEDQSTALTRWAHRNISKLSAILTQRDDGTSAGVKGDQLRKYKETLSSTAERFVRLSLDVHEATRNTPSSSQAIELRIFNGWFLEGSDLSGLELNNCSFARAHIERAKFIRSNLSHTSFEHAQAAGAQFHHANLESTTFAHANLSSAVLYTALQGVNFYGADLSRATLYTIQTIEQAYDRPLRAESALLSGANLEKANVAGARIEGTINPSLTKPDFRNTNLRGTNFWSEQGKYPSLQPEDPNLLQAQLDGAIFDKDDKRLPKQIRDRLDSSGRYQEKTVG